MNLQTPVQNISRIGPQYQKKLQKLGIRTIRDVLYHFPHRYEDFSNLIPIAKAEPGGPFCFQGQITDIKNIRTFRKRMVLTQATIEDETGKLKAMWFNQPYLINSLKKGDYLCLAGKINGSGSSKYLSSPAYEKIGSKMEMESPNQELTHTGRLIPVYPETEGVSSKWLRFIVKPLLQNVIGQVKDPLPERTRGKFDFIPWQKAMWQIHFPDSLEESKEAKKRFSFEELFNLSLFILRERLKLAREKSVPIPTNIDVIKEFTESLPFQLTDAQKKCAWQILKDMERQRPMNRLLEGDVGSGKTIVAAIASLNAAKSGFQTAFMAPTEILAKQHYKNLSRLFADFNLNIALITGKETYLKEEKIKRKEMLEKLNEGKVDIVVGTHTLVQDKDSIKSPAVKFKNLALAIIDEQHRFGTEQRAKLCQQKDITPHFLSMTATPIPRTLSLTVYGDLDLSVLDELPRGRKKIVTKIIQPKDKPSAYQFVREQVKEGRQIFVICPRIDPPKAPENGQIQVLSEANLSWMDVKAVKQEYEKLSKDIFPELNIGMLHGKMKIQEKENVMQDFKDHKIDILVATSVIEVGVDMPNASVMMIEGSEKFGLAQLHQFRGRVGRADHQSYCFLLTDSPGVVWNRRLKALVNCENGFELAEKDLAIRGPGDFVGLRQWGIPDLAMASLTDSQLIAKARNEAKEILQEDIELKKYPALQNNLREFTERIHLE